MKKSRILNPGFIYVLSLEKGYYYVGETGDLKRRLTEHVTGLYYDRKKKRWTAGGAVTTRALKPRRLIGLYRPDLCYVHFREIVKETSDLIDLENRFRKLREEEEVKVTLQCMEIYGKQYVRGARWCSPAKTPKVDLSESSSMRRPLCKCELPSEKKVTHGGKVKWICGIQLIQEFFESDLSISEKGLMFNLLNEVQIPVKVSCDLEKSPEVKRRLPESKTTQL